MTTRTDKEDNVERIGHRDTGNRQGRNRMKSFSPIRRVDGDIQNRKKGPTKTTEKCKSKSPMRQNQQREKKSMSPMRRNKSKSPTGNNKSKTLIRNNGSKSPTRRHFSNKSKSPTRKKNTKPATMTVIVNRCDLWDSAAHFQPDECLLLQNHHSVVHVLPYKFSSDDHRIPTGDEEVGSLHPWNKEKHHDEIMTSVAVARVPHRVESMEFPVKTHDECDKDQHHCSVIDTTISNPHDPNVVHDKYWAQRRRLFTRFDRGIQLDAEGWYSVTPEIIADHVADRVQNLVTTFSAFQKHKEEKNGKGIIILDGFCGCGGNAIAFGKIPSHIVSKIVCVDTDRSKLLKAAHNASLYDIPRDKLVFVQCNSIFILKHCYRNGEFILDQPQASLPKYMPPPVMPTTHAGYDVGGLDMLPRNIDLAFFDPPWGGIDYEILGKNGYDLERNMKILVSPCARDIDDRLEEDSDEISDDFFDTFTSPKEHHMSKKDRKKNFNNKTEGEFVNGKELIKLAAEASTSRVVLLDLPRNSSKNSLGRCALQAGYRGNIKLEEHYLNGRLKTVTAYFGSDYSGLINEVDVVQNKPNLSIMTNSHEMRF